MKREFLLLEPMKIRSFLQVAEKEVKREEDEGDEEEEEEEREDEESTEEKR